MALSETQLVDLTRRAHMRVLTVRSGAGARVGALWDRLAPIGDTAAAQFADTAAQLVVAGQVSVSTSTAGYLSVATGARGPSTPLSGPMLRGGVDPVEVYQRAIVTARTALAAGKPLAEALRIGRDRATSTAETDVMLAQRAQIDAWAQANQIVGYRRVLTGKSCLLCAVASTQRYHRDDLMPIHQRCDCGVSPIIGAADPGRIINRPLHEKLKQAGVIDDLSLQQALPKAREALANAEARRDRWRTELRNGIADQERETRVEQRIAKWDETVKARRGRVQRLEDIRSTTGPSSHIVVSEHGELGPVLTRPGDKFTAENDLG